MSLSIREKNFSYVKLDFLKCRGGAEVSLSIRRSGVYEFRRNVGIQGSECAHLD